MKQILKDAASKTLSGGIVRWSMLEKRTKRASDMPAGCWDSGRGQRYATTQRIDENAPSEAIMALASEHGHCR